MAPSEDPDPQRFESPDAPPPPRAEEPAAPVDPPAESGASRPSEPTFADDILELVEEPEERPPQEPVLERRVLAAPRIPGPGLGESVAWCFGVLVVHLIGGLLTGVGLIAYFALNRGVEAIQDQDFLASLVTDHLGLLMAGEMAFFVLAVLIATRLRLGRRTFAKLGMVPVGFLHLFLILLSVLPMSILCGQLYKVTDQGWQRMLDQLPGIKDVEPDNTVEALSDLSQLLPFWALLLAIAVAPAVGEELIFRGIIGRGLVARMGLRTGILITSILFAIVHMHPVHVVGVLPLGIYIHYLHITTRSFWAPMLMHFLNNAWAAYVSKYMVDAASATVTDEVSLHPLLLLSALVTVGIIWILLWETRKIYVFPDGTECTPGYFTVERPPMEAKRVSVGRMDKSLLLALIVSVIIFLMYASLMS